MPSSRGVDLFSPKNPDAPYFAIKIEDAIYDIAYNYIEQLSVRRTLMDVGTFQFTIDNAADLNLEDRFLALFKSYTDNMPLISFQYGWSNGNKSKWYRGRLLNYTPEFMPGGYMKLGVNGLLCGPDDTSERIAAYTGSKISDIVAAIAEDMGWVIDDFEETVPLDEPKTFHVTNIGTVDYIREELLKYATNAKNEPFKFYVETGNGGETHIRFISVNKKSGSEKAYNYYINWGNFGSVLNWSPSYSGTTLMGSIQTAMLDLDTNDVIVHGSSQKSPEKDGSLLTVYGATTPAQMGPMLANKWYQHNIGQVSASLTIVGDPKLVPWQQVNVLPMDAAGRLHRFTGGTYWIKQINDTIAGDYQTQMELIKNDGEQTKLLEEAVEYQGSE